MQTKTLRLGRSDKASTWPSSMPTPSFMDRRLQSAICNGFSAARPQAFTACSRRLSTWTSFVANQVWLAQLNCWCLPSNCLFSIHPPPLHERLTTLACHNFNPSNSLGRGTSVWFHKSASAPKAAWRPARKAPTTALPGGSARIGHAAPGDAWLLECSETYETRH